MRVFVKMTLTHHDNGDCFLGNIRDNLISATAVTFLAPETIVTFNSLHHDESIMLCKYEKIFFYIYIACSFHENHVGISLIENVLLVLIHLFAKETHSTIIIRMPWRH